MTTARTDTAPAMVRAGPAVDEDAGERREGQKWERLGKPHQAYCDSRARECVHPDQDQGAQRRVRQSAQGLAAP